MRATTIPALAGSLVRIRSCRSRPARAGLIRYRYVRNNPLKYTDPTWALYREETGEVDYYPITHTWEHLDPVIIYLTIDGELIVTTPEHPFLTAADLWLGAGELEAGDVVYNSAGLTGVVNVVETVEQSQWMYNLTVADAHTFFVGEGRWLVHNANCDHWAKKLGEYEKIALDKSGHLEAAAREIKGEVVKLKPNGTPFDHVQEVAGTQQGLRNLIADVTKQLNSGKLSEADTVVMEDLLSRASRALDYSEKYVPKGSTAGWTH